MDIIKRMDDKEREVVLLGNVGSIYCKLGRNNQAIAMYEKALDIVNDGDFRGKVALLSNKGEAFRSLGQYIEARETNEAALDIARKTENTGQLGMVLTRICAFYYNLDGYDEMKTYYDLSLAINRNIVKKMSEESVEIIYTIEEVRKKSRVDDICDKYGRAIEYIQPLYKLLRQMCSDMYESNSKSNLSAISVYNELMMKHSEYKEVLNKISTKYYAGRTFLSAAITM